VLLEEEEGEDEEGGSTRLVGGGSGRCQLRLQLGRRLLEECKWRFLIAEQRDIGDMPYQSRLPLVLY
jgi:hypothetical protein